MRTIVGLPSWARYAAALRFKLRLFFRPNTIVADVPYHDVQV